MEVRAALEEGATERGATEQEVARSTAGWRAADLVEGVEEEEEEEGLRGW